MSRRDWACRGCGRVLARRHHTGRLHADPEVTVYVEPKGRTGPYTRLICPACGRHRDYVEGPVVVRPRPNLARAR